MDAQTHVWFVKEIKPGIMQFWFENNEMQTGSWETTVDVQGLSDDRLALAHPEDGGGTRFSFSPYWIRLRGLPSGFWNKASAERLAPMFGKFRESVDIREPLFRDSSLTEENYCILGYQCSAIMNGMQTQGSG